MTSDYRYLEGSTAYPCMIDFERRYSRDFTVKATVQITERSVAYNCAGKPARFIKNPRTLQDILDLANSELFGKREPANA